VFLGFSTCYDCVFFRDYEKIIKHLKKPDTNEAAQSNKLIEASYKMSVPAKRVMLLLLGQIHPGQQEISSQRIRLEASEYSLKTGLSIQQSYVDLKSGCRELMRTIITTKDLRKKTTSECVVVDWMEYHENEGWLETRFTPWIEPYLKALTKIGYTKIKINEAVRFKRFYSIRLYELLMQWVSTGERYTAIEELRRIFQIEKKKYEKFSDFRKWVLEPSVKEINEKTSLKVSWSPVKSGRKITSVSFSFSKLPQKHLEQDRCPHTQDMFEDIL